MPDKEIISDRELILSQAMFRALTGIAELKAYIVTNYHETVPVGRVLKELEKVQRLIGEATDG